MELMDKAKAWIVKITELGLLLVALGVVLQMLFGSNVAFMGDVVGRLFSEFAVTLSVTILISAVVSLTLVPMMCAQLLHHRPRQERVGGHPEAQALGARWFARLIYSYDKTLIVVLRRQPLTLLVALGTVALTVFLYVVVPKGFFPVQDNGLIQAVTEAPQSISFTAMSERQRRMADAILGDSDVASLSSFIGVDGSNTTLNSGRISINLRPLDERSARAPDRSCSRIRSMCSSTNPLPISVITWRSQILSNRVFAMGISLPERGGYQHRPATEGSAFLQG